MTINLSVNLSLLYNGVLLPDIIMLTLRYYHYLGTGLNPIKGFCSSYSKMLPPKHFDKSPPPLTRSTLRRFKHVQIFS